MPEESLDGYDILERVASGGQATVYRTWDRTEGRIVALKVLHEHLTADLSYLERFRREAQIAAGLDHPNIARVFEVGRDRGRHYIAMEYLPESLNRVLHGGRSMPLEQAVSIAVQVLDALEEAHRHGVVHRDIKPQNILLSAEGTPKVADFGIARANDLATMTRTGVVVGTPQYMAPEQVRGERVDGRTDLYAVGVMLYQMISGSPPFEGDTPWQVVQKQLDQQAPAFPPGLRVPGDVERIVRRALEKDPARRYQDAGEMAEGLHSAIARMPRPRAAALAQRRGGDRPPWVSSQPRSLSAREPRRNRSHVLRVVGFVTAVVTLAAVTAALVARTSGTLGWDAASADSNAGIATLNAGAPTPTPALTVSPSSTPAAALVPVPTATPSPTLHWVASNDGLFGGGRVNALAVDPQHTGILYAGTDGEGVFKSTDGGNSWRAMDHGLTNAKVYAVAVDPQDPATVYAGILFGGVYKSTDGGGSWEAVNQGLPSAIVWSLALDPRDSSTVYVGGDRGGMYKSTNGGESWHAVNHGLPRDGAVLALALDPTEPSIVYAGTDDGLYRSTDGGASWQTSSQGLTNTKVRALALDSQDVSTVYAGTDGGLFRSTDGGASWQAINQGITAPQVHALAVDPRRPGTLYAGTGGGVFESTDRGNSWQPVDHDLMNRFVWSLAVDPHNSTTLYAGTDGSGVFKTLGGTSTLATAGLPKTTVAVEGFRRWTDSGIDLKPGEQVDVSATGIINIARWDGGWTPAGAEGSTCTNSPNFITSKAACWSLVGRVGNGVAFPIGATSTLKVTTPGELFLGVNDDVFGDNSGSWLVTISVTNSS